MFESGADERNVLPNTLVRCIFAAGKRRRRRLHQLFGEWFVVYSQLRFRLRPVWHQVLQRRHAHRHSSLHCEPLLTSEPFLAGELPLTGEFLRIFRPTTVTASAATAFAKVTASDKARHRRRRRRTRAA